jgi:hypothetical protein
MKNEDSEHESINLEPDILELGAAISRLTSQQTML